LLAVAGSARAAEYDYPVENPLVATVVGTPERFRPPLPPKIDRYTFNLDAAPGREVPQLYWYYDELECSAALQDGEAPLLFLIAGTGGAHDSGRMRTLEKVFYTYGFHVVSLSSPTHPSFIVTASSTGVPGFLERDARDLYRVMELSWERLRGWVRADGFYLAGYSLGGAHSAFVARLDEDRRAFGFRRVLLVNPPVSLYNSVRILDDMLVNNIEGGLDNLESFVDDTTRKFMHIYKTMGYIEFNDDFFYKVYERFPLENQRLAALVGLSFRFSAMNMTFTSDVVANAGLIVPLQKTLALSDSLTRYFEDTLRTSFTDYFHGLLYPHFARLEPGLTERELKRRASLHEVADYLRSSSKTVYVGTADDIILAPGEIDFLREVFGERAIVYPRGGHCGSMFHRDFVQSMIDLLQ
jgi:hypothetical protein